LPSRPTVGLRSDVLFQVFSSRAIVSGHLLLESVSMNDRAAVGTKPETSVIKL